MLIRLKLLLPLQASVASEFHGTGRRFALSQRSSDSFTTCDLSLVGAASTGPRQDSQSSMSSITCASIYYMRCGPWTSTHAEALPANVAGSQRGQGRTTTLHHERHTREGPKSNVPASWFGFEPKNSIFGLLRLLLKESGRSFFQEA